MTWLLRSKAGARAIAAVAVLGACGSRAPEAPPARPAAHVLLERFPSSDAGATGVDQWDLARVEARGASFVVARGYAVRAGVRGAVVEIVAPDGDAGRTFVRDAGRAGRAELAPERARAVGRDLAAMSLTLGGAHRGSGKVSESALRPLAGANDCDGGAPEPGSLVSPCPTQLLDCGGRTRAAAAAASNAAATLAQGAAGGAADPPEEVTLGDAGAPQDRDCVIVEDGRLDLNDVSILFPVVPGEQDLLMRADQPIGRAPLLPRTAFDRFPAPFVPGRGTDAVYGALRVVSARIDPCFPGDGVTCRNQLRFVLQPLEASASRIVADDSGVHVFFDVSRSDLGELARGLVQLKAAADAVPTSGPLRVHPALATLGLASPYGARLRELLVSTAARGRLSRVTFIARGGEPGKENSWRFGGFEVDAAGALAPMAIGSVPAPSSGEPQQMLTITGINKVVSGGRSTDPDARALAAYFDPIGMSDARATSADRAARRIENPRLAPRPHTSESLDCVSCHLATPSRVWAAGEGFPASDEAEFALAPFDLANTAQATMALPLATRAFSYFDTPAGPAAEISQRTINESAVSAAILNEEVLAAVR